MRIRWTIIFLFLIAASGFSQELKVVSWNLKDFGQSRDNEEIEMIAKIIKHADIVAIQEIVAKHPGGVKAVARLVDVLNRSGAKWNYRYSDPTRSSSGHTSERYAFIWKTSKLINIGGRPKLISELSELVEREPFLMSFRTKKSKEITIVNYHACTHKVNYPERSEIKAISKWLKKQDFQNTIWAGDMNLEIDDIAFTEILESGYKSILHGEETSLKKKCKNGNYLSSAEDNMLYQFSNLEKLSGRVIDFVGEENCWNLKEINLHYSDHLPLEMVVE